MLIITLPLSQFNQITVQSLLHHLYPFDNDMYWLKFVTIDVNYNKPDMKIK